MSWSKPYTLDFGPTGDNVKQGVDKLEDDVDDLYVNANKLKKTFYGTSAPTNPDVGQLWADSNTTPATLKIYDGADWTTSFSNLKSGFISGVNIYFKAVDEVTIDGFSLDINGVMYSLAASVDMSVTALDASVWYYIFVEAPSSGLIMTASEITYDKAAPAFDSAKGGWYDIVTGNLRCIGAFYSNGSSEVNRFSQLRGVYTLIDPVTFLSTTSPATTWTAISVNGPSLGVLQISVMGYSMPASPGYGVYGYIRSYGQTDANFENVAGLGVANTGGVANYFPGLNIESRRLSTNASTQIEYSVGAGYSISAYKLTLTSFVLPGGF